MDLSRNRYWIRLPWGLIACLLACGTTPADEHEMGIQADARQARSASQVSPVAPAQSPADMECGLYATIAALKAVGSDCDVERILNGSYLSHEWGSSGADLCRAITDQGAHAIPLRGIGWHTLEHARHPIILNLVSRDQIQRPGHWVTYLGREGEDVRIFDANAAPRVVQLSMAELLAGISGDGIAVLRDRPKMVDRWLPYFQSLGLLWPILLCGLIACAAPWVGLDPPLRQLSGIGQMAVLIGLAVLWCAGDQIGALHALMRNPRITGWIQANYMGEVEFPSVGYPQFEILRRRADVTVVDARTIAAYEYGHLPSAVNVPIDARAGEFLDRICDIPKTNAVIVYCNNDQCGWADVIAQRITAQNYKNVLVFRAGIQGYIEERLREPEPE